MRMPPSVVPAATDVPARRVVKEVTPVAEGGLSPPSSPFSSISHIAPRLGILPLSGTARSTCQLSSEESNPICFADVIRASNASHTLIHPSSQLDTSMVPTSFSELSSELSSESSTWFGRRSGIRLDELSTATLVTGRRCPEKIAVQPHQMAPLMWPAPHSFWRLYRRMSPEASPANNETFSRSWVHAREVIGAAEAVARRSVSGGRMHCSCTVAYIPDLGFLRLSADRTSYTRMHPSEPPEQNWPALVVGVPPASASTSSSSSDDNDGTAQTQSPPPILSFPNL
mmetsp:Transcript_23262/g.56129  ORF Transcript_23262/g.56129 Transcript_23262/m.56129 type:complete len:285 (-) Transcript_23262:1460-2314(-)